MQAKFIHEGICNGSEEKTAVVYIAGWFCRLLLQIALACLHSPVIKLGYPKWNCPPGPLCCDKKPESTAMCSWNLTENKGTEWDFPSKIKSLELKITPQKSTGSQKRREIINCKLGWLMLSGRVQSFEDELKIPCHSWICESLLGQMLPSTNISDKGCRFLWKEAGSALWKTTRWAPQPCLLEAGWSVIQSLQMTLEGTGGVWVPPL